MRTRRLLAALAAVGMLLAAGSCSEEKIITDEADLVVFGNIYTSEAENLQVAAFAVKDGKYVYVGDAKAARRRSAQLEGQILFEAYPATGGTGIRNWDDASFKSIGG